ncbi:6153_t:CDS:2, partial [Dentiscutata heterogama]
EFGSGGGTFITGWILGFFPYDRNGSALHQNHLDFENFPPPGTVETIVSPVIGWSIDDDDDDISKKNSHLRDKM